MKVKWRGTQVLDHGWVQQLEEAPQTKGKKETMERRENQKMSLNRTRKDRLEKECQKRTQGGGGTEPARTVRVFLRSSLTSKFS